MVGVKFGMISGNIGTFLIVVALSMGNIYEYKAQVTVDQNF